MIGPFFESYKGSRQGAFWVSMHISGTLATQKTQIKETLRFGVQLGPTKIGYKTVFAFIPPVDGGC